MLHLVKIEEIKHVDVNGEVLWRMENLKNVFHYSGEQYLLSVAFNTAGSITIPSNYYVGLDNRATPDITDTLLSLSEPTQNGYIRQAVSSANGFQVATGDDSNYRATSGIVTFSASGGSWGPVRNMFIATSSTSAGYLISSVALDAARTVLNGQSLTMRISLGLTNC